MITLSLYTKSITFGNTRVKADPRLCKIWKLEHVIKLRKIIDNKLGDYGKLVEKRKTLGYHLETKRVNIYKQVWNDVNENFRIVALFSGRKTGRDYFCSDEFLGNVRITIILVAKQCQ